MTRNFNTSITPSGGSESTANTTVTSQASSHTQDITFTGLTDNKQHAIKVRGTNETFNGSFSSTVNVTTADIPSAVINSFTATATSIGVIQIAYNVSNAKSNGIVIQRATNSGMSSGLTTILTTSTASQTFNNTGLANGTPFFFRLTATNEANESVQSSVITATTVDPDVDINGSTNNITLDKSTSLSGQTLFSDVVTVNSSGRGGASIELRTLGTSFSGFKVGHATGGSTPSNTSDSGFQSIGTSAGSTVTLADADLIKIRISREMNESSTTTATTEFDFRINGTSINSANVSSSFTITVGGGGGGAPGGGGGGDEKCIDTNMMLNMEDGMMYVDDVSIGDMVRTYNMDTKTDEYVEIEDVIRGPHYVYNVGLEEETDILITDSHPIMAENDNLLSIIPNEKIGSTKLNLGDKIRTTSGSREVISISELGQDSDTYTVITKNKNFYADGVLIHDGRIDR